MKPLTNMETTMSFETPEALAAELKMFTENDGEIYRGQTTSILKNLATKMVKGVYDPDKAVDLFMYLAESGAKKYAKEFGGSAAWHDMFPVDVRRIAAKEWRDEFEVEFENGAYDSMLPKKYQPDASIKAGRIKLTSSGKRQAARNTKALGNL
jgi:hypothetical protein